MKEMTEEVGLDEFGFRGNDAIVKEIKKLGAKLKKTRDEFERGLIVGRVSALNWRLGEPWDRSVVDVIATSSSRDDDAIREAYGEFRDKVWYKTSMSHIRKENIVEGSDKDQDYFGRLEIEKRYGAKNLNFSSDFFEWGVVWGRMSALAWVTGVDWGSSFLI